MLKSEQATLHQLHSNEPLSGVITWTLIHSFIFKMLLAYRMRLHSLELREHRTLAATCAGFTQLPGGDRDVLFIKA